MISTKLPGLILLLSASLCGCGRNDTGAAATELQDSFTATPPAGSSSSPARGAAAPAGDDVQQMVNQAVSAMKTNAYVEAAAVLQVLKNQPALTPDQRIAVQNASVAVQAKVAEAADRGDPAALRAADAIRSMPRR